MLRVIQVGLGALGRHMVRYAMARPEVHVVAAVDPAPALVGHDLGELCDVPQGRRRPVRRSPTSRS